MAWANSPYYTRTKCEHKHKHAKNRFIQVNLETKLKLLEKETYKTC